MAICPKTNQPENDLVMTPPELAKQLVNYIQPSGVCLDPSRGTGAFYDAMEVHADELHYCEITEGIDYMTASLSPKFDWVITNPPWSKIQPFMERSFVLAQNVALLATVTNFVTRKRLKTTFDAGFSITEFVMVPTPKSWTSTGFQVAMAIFKKIADQPTRWVYL